MNAGNDGKNRLLVALGSVGAVALLFGAFVVVWLLPRGPETWSADVAKKSDTTSKVQTSAPSTQAGAVSSAPISEQAHIAVQGTGTISARADMVNVQVGVQIHKDQLEDAQSEAASKMYSAIKQLKAAGIDDKDISTAQFNVEPVMNYQPNTPPQVTGFRVTNIVNVKVRDTSK